MKLHKLAIALLFAGGMIGASASMASAETPFELTDCAVGYEAVLSDDGSSGTCEPVAVAYEELNTDDGTCWTTPEGGDVCARGGVLGSTEEPVPASGCYDATDADGNESTICIDAVAYNALPTDGEVDPCQETPEMCEMTVGAPLMYKNISLAGSADGSSSNTLAALGVLFAALGAFGIGLSNQKNQTK
jgi:hypothetical protein